MADTIFNTDTPQYRKFLANFADIKETLAPRIEILKILNDRGDHVEVKWLIERDPLLYDMIKTTREFVDFLALEV